MSAAVKGFKLIQTTRMSLLCLVGLREQEWKRVLRQLADGLPNALFAHK